MLESAKQHVPDVVFLDIELPRIEVGKIVRILNRFPDTRAAVFILLAPGGTDKLKIRKLRSLECFDIFQRPLTCARITQGVEQAVRWSRELRQMYGMEDRNAKRHTQHVNTNNSLLVREVYCPFHKAPEPLDRFILRTGRIITEANLFDLPVYTTASKGADFINYHLLNVMVCPRCLFASNDPSHFIDPGQKEDKQPQFSPPTIKAIEGSLDQREAIAGDLAEGFFTEERDIEGALKSIRLGIASSLVLNEMNKTRMNVELLRVANYHLRLAHFAEELKQEQQAIDGHLKDALDWLEKAFGLLEGAQLYKCAYQLIAACVYFGDDNNAHRFLSRLVEIERDPTRMFEEGRGMLDRFLGRAKQLWSDRNEHRSPLIAGVVSEAPSEEPDGSPQPADATAGDAKAA